MSLANILNDLGDGSWLNDPARIQEHSGYTLSKRELNRIFDQAKSAVASNDIETSCNLLFLGLTLAESRFLIKVKKKSLLRISNRAFKSTELVEIVDRLSGATLGMGGETARYLSSLKNLYEVANAVRNEYDKLVAWLSKEKESAVKTALALLEFLSLKQVAGYHLSNKQVCDSRHPYFFSVEEMASGFSSLLAIYGFEIGKLDINGPISDQVDPDSAMDILNRAAHFAVFREWETCVNHLGYTFETLDEKSFELKPPSPEFLRGMEMGYIHTNKQAAISTIEILRAAKRKYSFRDFGPKFVVQLEDAGLVYKKGAS